MCARERPSRNRPSRSPTTGNAAVSGPHCWTRWSTARSKQESPASRATSLVDNPAPLRLLEEFGDVTVESSGVASQVEVRLRRETPGRLRMLLRTFAASALEPGLALWQRLFVPSRGRLEDERENVIVAAGGAGIAAGVAREL